MPAVRLYVLFGFAVLIALQGFAPASSEELDPTDLPEIVEEPIPQEALDPPVIVEEPIPQDALDPPVIVEEPIPQDPLDPPVIVEEPIPQDALDPPANIEEPIQQDASEDSEKVDEILGNPTINALQMLKIRTLNVTDVLEHYISDLSTSVTPILINAWSGWKTLPKITAGSIGSWLLSLGGKLLNVGEKLEHCSVDLQRCPLNFTVTAINTCLTSPLRDLSMVVVDLIVDFQIIIGIFLDGYGEMTEDPKYPCSLEEKLEKLSQVGHEFAQITFTTLDALGKLHGVVVNMVDGLASCFAKEVSYKVAIEIYGFAKYYFECIVRS